MAAELGLSAEEAELREVLTDFDRIGISVQFGESPRVIVDAWFLNEQSADKAAAMGRDQLAGARSKLKVFLGSMPSFGPTQYGEAPSPEEVDAMFETIALEQEGKLVHAVIPTEAFHRTSRLVARTPFAEAFRRIVGYETGLMWQGYPYGGNFWKSLYPYQSPRWP